MRRRLPRPGRAVAAVVLTIGSLLAGGCANNVVDGGEAKITLTVSTWGDFGFRPLIQQYQKTHTNIRVLERNRDQATTHEELARQIDAGKGAPDVASIDESYIAQYRERSNDFYNLLDFGAGEFKDRWLGWKWSQSLSVDGKYQIGLGADIGGMALCYRSDLLAAAGLPTDRDQLSQAWAGWDGFLDSGRRFQAARPGTAWLDGVSSVYLAMQLQQKVGYYDGAGNVALGDNAGQRAAFELAARFAASGQTARLRPGTAEWTEAVRAGRFAVTTCPTWGLANIRKAAPEQSGKWDVTAIPGGGGNWAGTFLTIPRQTNHPKEAYQLAAWLTAPAQQLRIFADTGNLPSQPALYDDPAVRDYRSDFASGAPVGQIYAAAARKLQPQVLGAKTSKIRAVMEETLRQVENGRLAERQAWATALSEATAAVSG